MIVFGFWLSAVSGQYLDTFTHPTRVDELDTLSAVGYH
jgi:hypothetical protein